MLAWVAPPTSNPVNVALVIVVDGAVVTKSSAVSVSSLPVLAVRERVALRPSGLPVLKKNDSADAWDDSAEASPRTARNRILCALSHLLILETGCKTPQRNRPGAGLAGNPPRPGGRSSGSLTGPGKDARCTSRIRADGHLAGAQDVRARTVDRPLRGGKDS